MRLAKRPAKAEIRELMVLSRQHACSSHRPARMPASGYSPRMGSASFSTACDRLRASFGQARRRDGWRKDHRGSWPTLAVLVKVTREPARASLLNFREINMKWPAITFNLVSGANVAIADRAGVGYGNAITDFRGLCRVFHVSTMLLFCCCVKRESEIKWPGLSGHHQVLRSMIFPATLTFALVTSGGRAPGIAHVIGDNGLNAGSGCMLSAYARRIIAHFDAAPRGGVRAVVIVLIAAIAHVHALLFGIVLTAARTTNYELSCGRSRKPRPGG